MDIMNEQKILECAISLFHKDDLFGNLTNWYYLEPQFKDVQRYIFVSDPNEENEDYKLCLSLLKKLHQDIKNVSLIVERYDYNQKLSKKGIIKGQWKTYTAIDIQYFFIELRSMMDYIAQIVNVICFRKGKKYNSFNKLLLFLGKNDFTNPPESDIVNVLMSYQTWFEHIRKIRDSLVHHGANIMTFDEDNEVLFQIYNAGLDEQVMQYDSVMYNDNIVYFSKSVSLHMAFLLCFLSDISNKLFCFLNNKEKIQLETSDDLKIYEEMYKHKIQSPGFFILRNWMLELANNKSYSNIHSGSSYFCRAFNKLRQWIFGILTSESCYK
jgi:hypothetical protein